MNLPSIRRTLQSRRRFVLLIAFLLLFAGIGLLFDRPKGESIFLLGPPLIAIGVALLAALFWPEKDKEERPSEPYPGSPSVDFLTVRGRLVPLFLPVGILLILADLLFNAFVSASSALQTHDQVLLLFAGVLCAYRFVPEDYHRERDFAFLFGLVLFLLLVVPLLLIRLFTLDVTAGVDLYSANLLAPQVAGILRLLGIPITHDGIWISIFTGQDVIKVGITTACSGLYSFSLFSAAFLGFVLTQYQRMDRRVAGLALLGILAAYLANVLRMVTIIYVGYTYSEDLGAEQGIQALLFAHSNAGWLIFLAWISLFWVLLFRVLARRPQEKALDPIPLAAKQPTLCPLCGTILKPDVPASRCACGRFYHVACLEASGECPACKSKPSTAYPTVHQAG